MAQLTLSDDWHQDEPLAYAVKCFSTTMEEYRVFTNRRDADDFASDQQYRSIASGEPADWVVYPLYAGNPMEVK